MVRPAALVLLTSLAVQPQVPERIDASAAAQFIGQTKKVCGSVAGLRGGVPTDRAPYLLDLGAPPPGHALTIAISARARRAFVAQFEERAPRLDVCATGKIDKTDDGLVLTIDEAHRITAVERRPREPFHANLPRPAQVSQEGLVGPSVIKDKAVTPKYTDAARKARVEGMVEIEAVVQADGTVGDVRVIKSIDALFGLDDEAVKAFRQWKFKPATRFGQPLAVVVVGVLRFDLFQ